MLSDLNVMMSVGNMSDLTLEGTYAARCAAASRMKVLVGMEQYAYVSAHPPVEEPPSEGGDTEEEEVIPEYTDPAEGDYGSFVQAESILAVMYHLPTRNMAAQGTGGIAKTNSQSDGNTTYLSPEEIEKLQTQFLDQAMIILEPYITRNTPGVIKVSERHGTC